jgi:signal transduction histidine kinase/ActR/RegA family two-component response regulator
MQRRIPSGPHGAQPTSSLPQTVRSLEGMEHGRRETRVLTELVGTINLSLDLDSVLSRVVDGARELCRSDMAQIALRDKSSGAMSVRHTVGSDGPAPPIEPGMGLGGIVLTTGRACRTDDYSRDPRFSAEFRALLEPLGITAGLAVPIRLGEQLEGILVVANRAAHPFSERDEAVLARLAEHAAIAIRNAQMLDSLKARQVRLERLLEVNRELSSFQPTGLLPGRITEACQRLLNVDSVRLWLREDQGFALTATSGEAREIPALPIGVEESLAGLVASTGRPLLVPDVTADPRALPEHGEACLRLGCVWMGVPVSAGPRLLGVLCLRTRRTDAFSAEEVGLATALASQAASSMENTRLYQQVEQTLEELQRMQSELVQAQKMEGIGRLAGGVAHDFNNMLGVMSGHGELLLKKLGPDSPLRRHAEEIQKAAERATSLTRQLLAFSRQQVLQPRVLDLGAVVQGMDGMLRSLIGEHVELLTLCDPGLGRVKADLAEIERVLLNLAVNARDAMPQGGRLTMRTSNADMDDVAARQHIEAGPGRYVMLEVSDTGCGMDEETRKHIFEPFFTTKGPGPGTGLGLGLATTYGIVRQSGGYIWVESEPGRGAIFKVCLPRVDDPLEELGKDPAESVPAQEVILLVEDQDALRGLVRELLEAEGYAVLEAEGAEQALQIAADEARVIDLLLTDVIMPKMSGQQLAERLVVSRPAIKVLYMSGYADQTLGSNGLLEPDQALLQKPFTVDALARRVREVLSASGAPR